MMDLESVISGRTCIVDGVEQIMMYLDNLARTPNSGNIDYFYDKLPDILNRIFDSRKMRGGGWLQIIGSEHHSHKEYNMSRKMRELVSMYQLLSPPLPENPVECHNNLFTELLNPHKPEAKYFISIEDLPGETQSLMRKEEYAKLAPIYHNLGTERNEQYVALAKDKLVLSPIEYFMFVFFSTIPIASHYNLWSRSNNEYKRYVSQREERQQGEMHGLSAAGIQNDPLQVLFLSYLKFFIQEEGRNTYDSPMFVNKYLQIMQEIWFSDHLLGTQHSLKYPISHNIITPLIIESIYGLIYCVQRRQLVNYRKNFLRPMEEEYEHTLQNTLFHFFRECFRSWTGESQTISTVTLLGFAKLWLRYITPSEMSDELNEVINGPFLTKSNPQDTDYEAFNYMPGSTPQIKTYWRGNMSTIDMDFLEDYALKNILFYTELLGDVLKAFSRLPALNLKHIDFLNQLQSAYEVNTEGNFINGLISKHSLKVFSEGLMHNTNQFMANSPPIDIQTQIIEEQLRSADSCWRNLNPFGDLNVRPFVTQLLIDLQHLDIRVLVTDNAAGPQLTMNINDFELTRNNILNGIANLFEIPVQELRKALDRRKLKGRDKYHQESRTSMHYHMKGSAWKRPMAPSDYKILIWIMKKLAYGLDKLRGKRVQYDQRGNKLPPECEFLREFGNLKRLICTVVFLLMVGWLIYFLVKTFIFSK